MVANIRLVSGSLSSDDLGAKMPDVPMVVTGVGAQVVVGDQFRGPAGNLASRIRDLGTGGIMHPEMDRLSVGSREFPVQEAADPNAFALKIRGLITDERRVLRIYGSEVVIARLIGDASRVRLHLINYGGRDIEGLRVRLRGAYTPGDAHVAGAGRVTLQDHLIADDATEFSLPRLGVYAAIDLTRATGIGPPMGFERSSSRAPRQAGRKTPQRPDAS